MSIVTKQGDRGRTRLCSGEEVSKADMRLEAYGTLDELVSFMGLARAFSEDREIADRILEKQEILFRLGTELATKLPSTLRLPCLKALAPSNGSKARHAPISRADVEEIDGLITGMESKMPIPRGFIIPGESKTAAFLDVGRTVCRRLERTLVRLAESGEWRNAEALVFINRLSDLLFLLARKAEGR